MELRGRDEESTYDTVSLVSSAMVPESVLLNKSCQEKKGLAKSDVSRVLK